jgi:hypothetical protein
MRSMIHRPNLPANVPAESWAQVLMPEPDAFVAVWSKDEKLRDGPDRIVRHGHVESRDPDRGRTCPSA